MIRVGRTIYDANGTPHHPSYPGFERIVVLMKSHSEWGSLGPYNLVDDEGRIFENIYQGSKCYKNIPATKINYSRWDNRVIWQHPAEQHVDNNGNILPAYWQWREKVMKNKFHLRYPVGKAYAKYCLFAIPEDNLNEKLDYISSRKRIYAKLYIDLVRKQPKYDELITKLENGQNLLITEVDGPHQESIDYYVENYLVDEEFIENDTMEASEHYLNIMLNDDKHPFGHGYCLAMALNNSEWLLDI